MMESVKSDSSDMTAAIIPLPAYHHNAKNWFLQVESIFSMLRISSLRARFANVMQKLPSDMMDEISDVLSDLREHEPYDHLKEATLKRFEEDMIQEILRNVTRGDKTPTQLLRYIEKSRSPCAHGQGNQPHLDNNGVEPPAENGEATRACVGFIAHLAIEPGTVELPVHTRQPGETSKPESGDD
ncbi:unnamed protein product [Acanthosepion pharaonis]|uniref:DUF7041 domain-containing protein n=1 Tax=Acanthosepion pharaonis TaxID=158019 RepID=A0A812DCH9_ACAPH|nr:unnamed protein product [Sepia pharaonis]